MAGRPDTFEAQWWRGLAVLRTIALLYAAGVYLRVDQDYAHPGAGWLTLAGMALWTAVASWLLGRPAYRRWPFLSLDLLVAATAIVVSRPLQGVPLAESGAQTLPVLWVVVPVIGLALAYGWWAAVPAAAVIGVANVLQRGTVTAALLHNTVLVLLAGLMVGYVTALARQAERRASEAVRRAAGADERDRLARAVHDGVLQVLALVARRGPDGASEQRRLADLAAEQERALRTLISGVPQPRPPSSDPLDPPPVGGPVVDLRTEFAAAAAAGVSVADPGSPVLLPADVAREVGAAATAALDNTARHGGAGARSYVLIEELPDEVVVIVRDDGVGFAPGRLEQARAEGRLGVSGSILGRLAAVGGVAGCRSTPGEGVEVVLRAPRHGSEVGRG